jgi:hypothetical protein
MFEKDIEHLKAISLTIHKQTHNSQDSQKLAVDAAIEPMRLIDKSYTNDVERRHCEHVAREGAIAEGGRAGLCGDKPFGWAAVLSSWAPFGATQLVVRVHTGRDAAGAPEQARRDSLEAEPASHVGRRPSVTSRIHS